MLALTGDEVDAITELLASLSRRYDSAEDKDLLRRAPLYARQLPARLHEHLNNFRRDEPGYTTISGYPVDDSTAGPTPRHWRARRNPSPTLDLELLLVLQSALLGDAFGWATQQDGHIVHDVLPIKEHEGEQLGSAADVVLAWHTEDAFHPSRPDWLILACVRNPTNTPTSVARADDLRLSDDDRRVLREPRFLILPDNSHLPKHNTASDSIDFGEIDRLRSTPPSIPLMWGDPDRPYLRADESFWQVADPEDDEASGALQRLSREIDRCLFGVNLSPGDLCVLDNYKVVHGRRPFQARYDGTDRWLKRVCVTRDLRKSSEQRTDPRSHVLT